METTRTFEVKEGREWVAQFANTDPVEVFKWLTDELIAKKLNQCAYIRSIKRENLYNGFQRITVTYSSEHGGRSVYVIPN